MVIGIENKIDAKERDDQLSDYQAVLQQRFGGPTTTPVLVFLTPHGSRDTSQDPNHVVPCVPLSYAVLLRGCEIARAEAADRDSVALDEIHYHLEEEIMNSKIEMDLRRQVHQLWKRHPRALHLAMRHRPTLVDIQDDYEEKLRQSLSSYSLLFTRYPDTRRPREIKMQIKEWKQAGLPITFMLHTQRKGQSDIVGRVRSRVLVHKRELKAHHEQLKEWASSSEAREVGVDSRFPVLPSWSSWHHVLKEDEFPSDAVVDDGILDTTGATADGAAEKVRAQVEEMKVSVAKYLERQHFTGT